jgi:ribonuclease H2 subunit A
MAAYELGIDEAGRGPVMGPMVYACCAWPVERREQLARLGFKDSKVLPKIKRDELFCALGQETDVFTEHKVISANTISNSMLGRYAKTSLNELSFRAAEELITRMLEKGIYIVAVYIDTVGPPSQYKERLERHFIGNALNFTVESKADANYPVVSAASVVAKVTRDSFIEELQSTLGEVGCGYPSDPLTQRWLNDNFHPVTGFLDNVVRMSWSTVKDKCESAVQWPDYTPKQEKVDDRVPVYLKKLKLK